MKSRCYSFPRLKPLGVCPVNRVKLLAKALRLLKPAAVLHYGQEVFEGLKAYRWAFAGVTVIS